MAGIRGSGGGFGGGGMGRGAGGVPGAASVPVANATAGAAAIGAQVGSQSGQAGPQLALLEKLAKSLGEAFASLLQSVGDSEAFKNLMAAVKPLGDLFARLGVELRPVVQGFRLLGSLGEAVRTLPSLLADASRRLASTVGGAMSSMGAPLRAPIEAFGGALGAVLGPLKGVGEAAWSLMQPFQTLAGTIQPFISALNPALAQALSYSLRELQATFGLLVQPIGQVLAPLIREVAATLQPVFRVLGAILGQFAQSMGRVVVILTRSFATVLQSMAPLFEQYLGLVATLAQTLAPLAIAFAAIMEGLKPLIKIYMDILTPVYQSMARAVVLVTAALLKMAGSGKAVEQMIQSLRDRDRPGAQSAGLQAAQNVQFTGVSEYGRSLMLASTIAAQTSPGERKKDTSEYFETLIERLDEINKGDAWKAFKEEVHAMIVELGNAIVRAIRGEVYGAATSQEGAASTLAMLAGPLGISAYATYQGYNYLAGN